ncbi:MAG: NADH-quinone oxidoreductase subunit L [Candidatus Marinimicrobia bacterium]|nr:NADH-quinone oxidoreductase subunit L [Candidatus Neomarinimicrobiota bacterium]
MNTVIIYSLILLFLPLLAFGINILIGKRLPRKGDWVSVAAILISFSFALSLFAYMMFVRYDPNFSVEWRWTWIDLGGFVIELGVLVDNLTVMMLLVVTLVSSLIHIYSISYMAGDPRYNRYFAYLSLFSFSMLIIVISNNLFGLYIGWELVGISSYLLIGFWFEKDSASNAGKKAFLTNRIGDFGFFLGILLFFSAVGSFNYSDIFEGVKAGDISGSLLTAAGIALFAGAIGKSAQVPLHIWLPDAMEGPAPVSALIHAATMVAAGVYMIGRIYPMFSPGALLFIAYVGAITAFLTATIAIVRKDIKRVLAYSTVSQLGYMIMALGVGGYAAGLWHLTTHAFFKALLFLGAGSVIHAVHTNDMFKMGGLRKKMPITFWTFLIATLAISGVPGFSGFFSKDAILAAALEFGLANPAHIILFILALVTAGMTAFYMFRALFITFYGKPRDEKIYAEVHESPGFMTLPMVILAALTVFITIDQWRGFEFLPGIGEYAGWFNHLVQKPEIILPALMGAGGEAAGHAASEETAHTIAMWLSIFVAGTGILLAYLFYYKKSLSAEKVSSSMASLFKLLRNKYYFDEFYGATIIRGVLGLAKGSAKFDDTIIDGAVNGTASVTVWISKLSRWFDDNIVDGAVNGTATVTTFFGTRLRKLQTGTVENYVAFAVLGIMVFFVIQAIFS